MSRRLVVVLTEPSVLCFLHCTLKLDLLLPLGMAFLCYIGLGFWPGHTNAHIIRQQSQIQEAKDNKFKITGIIQENFNIRSTSYLYTCMRECVCVSVCACMRAGFLGPLLCVCSRETSKHVSRKTFTSIENKRKCLSSTVNWYINTTVESTNNHFKQ